MSHSNISIFVPHYGCPNQCTFCNQKYITGQENKVTASDIELAVKTALSSDKFRSKDGEIAFFGGSFTAIDKDYMLELLSTAYRFVKDGSVSGIRISTRPDCINDEILKTLKEFGVTAIELGAQSMCDDVLKFNKRGHLAQDVIVSSRLIKKYDFELGLQMMTGLYKSDYEKDLYTAKEIIKLNPDTVRIYPTITIKNTELEQFFNEGKYLPPHLDATIKLCAKLLDLFESNDIPVIRLGLHSIDENAYVAGPWHQSFRELCDSYRFRCRFEEKLNINCSYIVYVSPTSISKAIGQRRSNIQYFNNKNIHIKIVSDNNLKDLEFIIEEVK